MAEALTVVGAIASTIQLVEFHYQAIRPQEKGLAFDLDEKMKQKIANQDQNSVKENWLSIVVHFYIPDRTTVQESELTQWDPPRWLGFYLPEPQPPKTGFQVAKDPTCPHRKKIIIIEEENDRYWEMRRGIRESIVPQHQTYTAWVEWFYEKRTLYDYPIPIDKFLVREEEILGSSAG
ncbi:hypothetical protein N7490_003403 [Penicillium lividum]|nr:hypothetical protein N7490_003403 [Penicillium lividum]